MHPDTMLDPDVRMLVLRWVPPSHQGLLELVCRTWQRLVRGCESNDGRSLLRMRFLYLSFAHLSISEKSHVRMGQLQPWFEGFWATLPLKRGAGLGIGGINAPAVTPPSVTPPGFGSYTSLLQQLCAECESHCSLYEHYPMVFTPCAAVALRMASEYVLAHASMHFDGIDPLRLFGSLDDLHTMWNESIAFTAIQEVRRLNGPVNDNLWHVRRAPREQRPWHRLDSVTDAGVPNLVPDLSMAAAEMSEVPQGDVDGDRLRAASILQDFLSPLAERLIILRRLRRDHSFPFDVYRWCNIVTAGDILHAVRLIKPCGHRQLEDVDGARDCDNGWFACIFGWTAFDLINTRLCEQRASLVTGATELFQRLHQVRCTAATRLRNEGESVQAGHMLAGHWLSNPTCWHPGRSEWESAYLRMLGSERNLCKPLPGAFSVADETDWSQSDSSEAEAETSDEDVSSEPDVWESESEEDEEEDEEGEEDEEDLVANEADRRYLEVHTANRDKVKTPAERQDPSSTCAFAWPNGYKCKVETRNVFCNKHASAMAAFAKNFANSASASGTSASDAGHAPPLLSNFSAEESPAAEPFSPESLHMPD